MAWEKFKMFYQWSAEEALLSSAYWYGVALFIFLLLCFWSLRKLKRELVPVFSDEEGDVQITPHALEELVRKTCEDIKEVYSPRTSIVKKGQSLRLLVRLRVHSECLVRETRSKLKNELETVLVENLNFSNFGGVDIVIKGFQDKE